MSKVVYLLGAGFSRPLGLPLMTDFVTKSRDMYESEPDRYKHFGQVLRQIRKLAVAKNYYKSDLFNIEEILSILEMSQRLEGGRLRKPFIDYIADVVEFHTPKLTQNRPLPSNWHDSIFGATPQWRNVGFFVASLFGLELQGHMIDDYQQPKRLISYSSLNQEPASYSVVTLNYDRVLESVSDLLTTDSLFRGDPIASIAWNDGDSEEVSGQVPLCKLHGSADRRNIVPPTWSKSVGKKILPAWKLAFRSLSEMNHLRIVGYSLPDSDAYVRYLLKSAILKTPNLKTIDVLTLDPDGSTKKRYEEFIEFGFRFANRSVSDYLNINRQRCKNAFSQQDSALRFIELEKAHEEFFSEFGNLP